MRIFIRNLLLVGASGLLSGASCGGNAPIEPNCPVPVCTFFGTTTDRSLVGDELWDTGTAEVTWTYVGRDSSLWALYRPSGTVTAHWEHNHCQLTLSPASSSIKESDGELRINWNVSPAVYSGNGSSLWAGSQTWSCPGSDPFEQEEITTKWFDVPQGVVDGTGIKGTLQDPDFQRQWEFNPR